MTDMLNIQIRPVTPPDVPAISVLAREIWQAAYPGIITQDQIDFMLEQRYGHERLYDDLEDAYKWLDQAFQDGTHHNNYGSYELARCIVEGIRANAPALAKFLADDAGTKPFTMAAALALPSARFIGTSSSSTSCTFIPTFSARGSVAS